MLHIFWRFEIKISFKHKVQGCLDIEKSVSELVIEWVTLSLYYIVIKQAFVLAVGHIDDKVPARSNTFKMLFGVQQSW